jgi:mono/diheme cytochrome c family protein
LVSGKAAAECTFPGDPNAGEEIYNGTCVACHGEDGRGVLPGMPDFTKKGGVLSKPHSALAKHIEEGFESGTAPVAMPPRGGDPGLSDQDINDVHSYLHVTFGCG